MTKKQPEIVYDEIKEIENTYGIKKEFTLKLFKQKGGLNSSKP
jgi:hypothetical protein